MFNRKIYRVMAYNHGKDCPSWKHPTMENVYVKQLEYCEQNPECTGNELSDVGSADIWKTLVNWGMIDQSVKHDGSRRHYVFTVTDDGQELLEKARSSKWMYDFIKFIKDTNSKTVDELDVNSTIFGCHFYVEHDFLSKLSALKNEDDKFNWRTIKRKVMFINELIARLDCTTTA